MAAGLIEEELKLTEVEDTKQDHEPGEYNGNDESTDIKAYGQRKSGAIVTATLPENEIFDSSGTKRRGHERNRSDFTVKPSPYKSNPIGLTIMIDDDKSKGDPKTEMSHSQLDLVS